MARMLVTTTDSMGRVTSTGTIEGLLQTQGEKALKAILGDLRRSGFRTQAGKIFPSLITDGTAVDPAFSAHNHVPGPSSADLGEVEFGVQQGIVFVLPSDLDNDRRPELDAELNGFPELDGNRDGIYTDTAADIAALWDPLKNTIDDSTTLCWSHDEISFVVVPGADGRNVLERRVGGNPAATRVIARGVDRVVFDTPESSGWALPLNAVRIRLFLRTTDRDGRVFKSRNEVTISLRNS